MFKQHLLALIITCLIGYGASVYASNGITHSGEVYAKAFIPAHYEQRMMMVGKVPMFYTAFVENQWKVYIRKCPAELSLPAQECAKGEINVNPSTFEGVEIG